jgi:hypothetical protein
VAVTGVIFYGLLSRGYAVAYRWSVAEMAVLLLGVAALTFLIPRKPAGLCRQEMCRQEMCRQERGV